MATEKGKFMKEVVILCDTRELKNQHIIDALDAYNIKHENKTLDFGSYSFKVGERDFSLSCVVERKANINELWSDITKGRKYFENELAAAHNIANSVNLLIENISDWDALKKYQVSDVQMMMQGRKVQNIGEYVHNTLKSWSSANRYNFDVVFIPDARLTAIQIISIFYWYYHNYIKLLNYEKF